MCSKTSLRVAPFCFLTLLLGSCGGGGDPAPVNLELTSLTILSDTPEISYPLRISIGISSDFALDEAFVSLFVMEKTTDPEADVRQIPLGTAVIPQPFSNAAPVEVEINIPASVEFPGDYNLVAIVDPTDEYLETDEEDNALASEITIAPALVPNMFIAGLELDRSALEINTGAYEDLVSLVENNVYNADAASTLTVGVDGLHEDETIDIESFAILRMTRSDVGTTHDVPLYLWNSDAARYINAYGVDPSGGTSDALEEWLPLGNFEPQRVSTLGEEVTLDDVTRNSNYMNFYFPGRLGSTIAYEMRYGHLPVFTSNSEPSLPPPDLTAAAISSLRSFLRNLPSNGVIGDESDAMAIMNFDICVQIRPVEVSVLETDVADNESCVPLLITLPPEEETILPPVDLDGYTPVFSRPSRPLLTDIGYHTKGGGSAFGFGIDLGSYASADERGYREGIYGDLPITIFGKEFSFMKLDVDAQLVPDYTGKPADEDSHFRVEYRHAGQLLTRIVEVPSDVTISLSLDELSISKELPDAEKGNIAESTIFVGPIPLSAGAYVSGNFGMDIKPFVFTTDAPEGYQMGIQAGPFASLEALMYAGIGSRRLPVIVGVEGVLSLLDGRFVLFNGVDIDVIEQSAGSETVEFVIRQGPKGTIVFTGPQGKLNLFAEYTVPKIKTCKIGLIKIPCPGFAKLKATKNLWSSPALFKYEDVLFELNSAQLDVVIREGKDPLYFQP